MAKVAVLYYSKTGNTEKMAQAVKQGVENSDSQAHLARIEDFNPEDLPEYEGIIIGSPTYYGLLAGPVKDFLDRSIKVHGQLKNKIGAAFSSCATTGGGVESTILSILETMMVHGMLVKGFSDRGHYVPISVEEPDKRALKECRQLGEDIGNLVRNNY